MVLRKKAQGLTSNIEQPNWEPRGSPNVTALNSWPASTTQPCNPHSWSNAVPASTSMPGGTRGSRISDHAHHYKMGSMVMEPRTTIGGLMPTLALSLLWKAPRDMQLPDQLTDSESCVTLCRQCWSYLLVLLSLLKQGQEQIIIREIIHCTGGHYHKTYID